MSLKMKLVSLVSLIILSVGFLIVGVLAVTQQITLSGNFSFNMQINYLWIKDVRISHDNYTEQDIPSFMPGYVNEEFDLDISSSTNTYGAFTLHFDIINTTTTAYSVTADYSQLSSSGVTVTLNPSLIPASGSEITSITSSTPLTTTLDIVVTNPNLATIDLSKIVINIEEAYVTNITAIASPQGYGSVSGSGQYMEGEEISLTATPQSGYVFKEWRSVSTTGEIVSTNPTYSFVLTKSSPATYYAIFSQPETPASNFRFSFNDTDKTATITSYVGSGIETLVIPERINKLSDTTGTEGSDYAVTAIADGNSLGNGVFSGYTGIKKVVFPSTLKVIGDYAFSMASGVEAVDFSKCTALESIGTYSFHPIGVGLGAENRFVDIDLGNCTALTSIGAYTFGNIINIGKLVIPENLRDVGNFSFWVVESVVGAPDKGQREVFLNSSYLYQNGGDGLLVFILTYANKFYVKAEIVESVSACADIAQNYTRSDTANSDGYYLFTAK